MKAGWETHRLGDLLQVQNGYAFDAKAFSPEGEMPLIRIRDLKGGVETETRFTGPYDTKYVVNAGDFLIGMDGEFVCHEWKGPQALLNQRVCRLQNFSSKLVSRFLFYGINSHLKDIEDVTGFTTVKHLSSKQILGIDFLVPPMPEQQRIVTILDEAFAGIATARAAAEQNRQNARALFESHLQSVFSQRGEGWVEKPLCEVATILNGYAFKSGDFSSDGATKSIKITNVGVREFVETSDSGLPANFAEQFSSVAAPTGSLVIALTRTIIADGLKVAVVPPAYDRALVNQRVAALLPKPEEVSASYLFAYLSTSIVLNYVKARVNTLMQPNLSINDLRSLPIPLPPANERESIIDRLNALEEETQRLEALYQRKLEALDELKQSLLHQAFSGQL